MDKLDLQKTEDALVFVEQTFLNNQPFKVSDAKVAVNTIIKRHNALEKALSRHYESPDYLVKLL